MEIKKLNKILLTLFWATVIVTVFMVVAYETGLFVPGALIGDKVCEFAFVTGFELLTVCIVPLALRLFRFGYVARSIRQHGEKSMSRWAVVRLSMLGLPLVFNTLLYYLYLNTAFGYMAIILLLSMAFVYPSESRIESEMMSNDETKE